MTRRWTGHRRGARFLVAASLVLGVTRIGAAEAQPRDEAKAHFQRGLELVDARRFEDASVEFESAYALSPRAAVLYNIGMTHAAARRYSRAVDAFERYLASDGSELEPKRVADIRAQLDELRAQVASVRVNLQPPEGAIRVDGQLVRDPHAILLDPGSHVIAASAPDHAESSRNISVKSGERLSFELVLQPLAKAATPRSTRLAATSSPMPVAGKHGALQPDSPAVPHRQQANERQVWLAASAALGGLLLAGATTAFVVDNQARYSRWKDEQAALDDLRRRGDPAPPQRQTANDELGDRIKLHDEISVGVGVASGACLIVAAVVWFAGGGSHEPGPRLAWLKQQDRAEVSFTW